MKYGFFLLRPLLPELEFELSPPAENNTLIKNQTTRIASNHWKPATTPKTYDELVKLVESGINYFNHISRSCKINGHTPAEHWNMAI